MLTPSYSELMEKINTDLDDAKVTSRYTIVLAVAKRARQIIDGADPLTYAPTDRAVSIAVKEMGEGKIKINLEEDLIDGGYERLLATQSKFKAIVAASSDDLREDLKDDYEPVAYIKDDDEDNDIEVDFKDGFIEVSEDEYLYDENDEDDAGEVDDVDDEFDVLDKLDELDEDEM